MGALLSCHIGLHSVMDAMPTPTPTPAARCLNCDAPLGGQHCHDCGQLHRRPRLDVNDLAHDAFDNLVGLDTKVWRTMRDLTLRPGQAALAYVNGHRARYINPLKYLVFAVALLFVVIGIVGLRSTDLGPGPRIPAGSSPEGALEEGQIP